MNNELLQQKRFGELNALNSTLEIMQSAYKNQKLEMQFSPIKKNLLQQQQRQVQRIVVSKFEHGIVKKSVEFAEPDENRVRNKSLQGNEKSFYQTSSKEMLDMDSPIKTQISPSYASFSQLHKKLEWKDGRKSQDGKAVMSMVRLNQLEESSSDESSDNDEVAMLKSKVTTNFKNMVEKVKEENKRHERLSIMNNRFGIVKQSDEKFNRFLMKNAHKLIETPKEQIINKHRSMSIDKMHIQQFEYKDFYDVILSKEKVVISNSEDAWVIINILKKPRQSRAEKIFLKKSLQNITLFEKHSDAVFKNQLANETLYQSLGYKFYKKNECIFHMGDEGDTYFIILRGCVTLLLPKSVQDAQILEVEAEFRNRQNKNLKFKMLQQVFSEKNEKQACPKILNLQQIEKQGNQEIRLIKDHLVPLRESSFPVTLQLNMNSKLLSSSTLKDDPIHKNGPQVETTHTQNAKFERRARMPHQLGISATIITESVQQPQLVSQKIIKTMHKENHLDFAGYINSHYSNMQIIKEFLPGEAFGEIALLTRERRTGTMVCKEDTHLMTLKKDGFDKIMGHYNSVILNEKLKFFKKYEFLRDIPTSKLMVLLHETKIQFYSKKQIIYTEKDPLTYLYFLKEGDVSITEFCASSTQQNSLSLNNSQNAIDIDPKASFLDKYCLKQKNQRKDGKRIVVYQQSASSFFGELELLESNISLRIQRAECVSLECTIYAVKKDFLKECGGLEILLKESSDKRLLQAKLKDEFLHNKIEKIIRQIKRKDQKRKRQKLISDSLIHNNSGPKNNKSPHKEEIISQLAPEQSLCDKKCTSPTRKTNLTEDCINISQFLGGENPKSQQKIQNISAMKPLEKIVNTPIGLFRNFSGEDLDISKIHPQGLDLKLNNSNTNAQKNNQLAGFTQDHFKSHTVISQHNMHSINTIYENQQTKHSSQSNKSPQGKEQSPPATKLKYFFSNRVKTLSGFVPKSISTLPPTLGNSKESILEDTCEKLKQECNDKTKIFQISDNQLQISSVDPTIPNQQEKLGLSSFNHQNKLSHHKDLQQSQFVEQAPYWRKHLNPQRIGKDENDVKRLEYQEYNHKQNLSSSFIRSKSNSNWNDQTYICPPLFNGQHNSWNNQECKGKKKFHRQQNSLPFLKDSTSITKNSCKTQMSTNVNTPPNFNTIRKEMQFSLSSNTTSTHKRASLLGNTNIDELINKQDILKPFKTTKQIESQIHAQTQIKEKILKSFISDSHKLRNDEINLQGLDHLKNKLNLISNNQEEAKSLKKSILCSIISKSKIRYTKPKTFNTVHINIIQKLNIRN